SLAECGLRARAQRCPQAGNPPRISPRPSVTLSPALQCCTIPTAGFARTVPPASSPHRAAWMSGRWGLMVHWIPPGPAPEKGIYIRDADDAVHTFNVDRFLHQFSGTNADWLIFTIGQNTGFYSSPNNTLDQLAGPGHTSRRDLVLELAQGVNRLGRRFI